MSEVIPLPFSVTRIVGIQHRCKKTADGAARPTAVAFIDPLKRKPRILKLETEQDEIDFVRGCLPVKWEKLPEGQLPTPFHPRFVLPKEAKKNDAEDVPIRYEVPESFEGLARGDAVAMLNGGSGRALSIAVWDQARRIGATLRVLTPGVLKDARDARGAAKEDDAALIGELLLDGPERFSSMTEYDRRLAVAVLAYRAFIDAMKRRIATGQQLAILVRERAFVSLADQGDAAHDLDLELAIKDVLANDPGHLALLKAEKDAEKEMDRAMSALPTYAFILAQPGIGPRIAARLTVSIGDMLSRYEPPDPAQIAALRAEVDAGLRDGRYEDLKDRVTVEPGKNPGEERYRRIGALVAHCESNGMSSEASRLKAARAGLERIHRRKRAARDRAIARLKHAMGVHVRRGGRYADVPEAEAFPRRKKGMRANWDEDGRQGIWLLMDQFNRHPDWPWGQRLLAYKKGFQEKHPATVTVPIGKGKPWVKYTKKHIHQMAIWRTATRFVEWLGRELLRQQLDLRRQASVAEQALRLPERAPKTRAAKPRPPKAQEASLRSRRREAPFPSAPLPAFGRFRISEEGACRAPSNDVRLCAPSLISGDVHVVVDAFDDRGIVSRLFQSLGFSGIPERARHEARHMTHEAPCPRHLGRRMHLRRLPLPVAHAPPAFSGASLPIEAPERARVSGRCSDDHVIAPSPSRETETFTPCSFRGADRHVSRLLPILGPFQGSSEESAYDRLSS